jgi:hypothetical protein
MLEERERGQADNLRHLKRIATRILWGFALIAVICLLSLKETRDLLMSLLQDPPAKPVAKAAPATPGDGNLDEESLKKVADMVSKSTGGKTLDKGDIEFGMELLNFMQTPPHKDDTTAKPGEK